MKRGVLIMVALLVLTVWAGAEDIKIVGTGAGAIAFGTYANAAGAAVTILNINGVQPKAASYPHASTLALIYKDANLSVAIKAFVSHATSPKAEPAIARYPAELAAVLRKGQA